MKPSEVLGMRDYLVTYIETEVGYSPTAEEVVELLITSGWISEYPEDWNNEE